MVDGLRLRRQWEFSKRKDARDVVTTYEYDVLNRNTSVTYTNDPASTPTVTRTYDGATNGKGRLWKNQTTGDSFSLTTIDGYDPLGRPLVQRQQFAASDVQFTVKRTYDLAGHVLTQTYPSGHTVTYTYDSAGRISNFNGNLGDGETRTYASLLKYDAASRLQQEQYGTHTALYHKLHYNSRGQLYDMRLSTQSLQAAEFDGDRGALINYYSNQNFTPGYSGSDNNGNVIRSETYIPNSGFAQDNYQYDSLNRLISIVEKSNGASEVFAQSYHYDRFGNRTINMQNGATWGTGINNVVYGVDPANNRLTAPAGSEPLAYDAAGNLTQDPTSLNGGNATYIYDAENRLSGVHFGGGDGKEQEEPPPDIQYIYDAAGSRVRRITQNDDWQVYGMDGELLAEYSAGSVNTISLFGTPNTLPQKEYGYRGGELLVTAGKSDERRVDRFITNFYFAAFGRAPTTELYSQQSAFMQAAQQGQSQVLAAARSLGQQLFDLENANGTYNQRQRTNTQFVTDLYFAYLQRSPDSSGLSYWVNQFQNPTWTRIQARTEFELSGEFAAIVSTVYGINNGEISGRVARYVSNMYLAVPGGSGSQANDTVALEAAAAEGQSQAIQAARTIGINLFQPWISGPQTNQEFVSGLFNAFLQREPSTTEVNTWIATVQSQGRSQALQSFANLSATQELAGTLYREILWLTSDQLGTPRIISERSGSLAGIKRHDYLPFGEELAAGTGGRTLALGYSGDNVRQKFTSKERDNETGLDYFLARYYSSAQGRFTSTDPVIVTPERFYDPQQFNLYAYTRNNPLRFIDPTGETLTISGDLEEVKRQLQQMLGTDDAAKRIKFDEKTNTITVDLTGIDLTKNEGAALLNDVTTSNKVYDVSVGTSVTTLGGQLSLVPTRKGGDWQANLDNNPDERFRKGKPDISKPRNGIDDQIAFNFDYRDKNSESTTKLKQAPNWTTTFHELAEAYAKVSGGMQYSQAHQKAIDRETRLRDQRPYLKENNPGSGPGTNVIIRK